MNRRLQRFILCLLPLAASFAAMPASAAPDECILGPAALPWLSGVPTWFDPGGGASWRPELHDPRWSGTPLRRLDQLSSSGEGSGSEVTVRALVSAGKLYFSYQVAAGQDDAPNDFDGMYLAFNQGAANGGYVLEIAPVAGTAGTTPTLPAGFPSPFDPTPPHHIDAGSSFRWWHTNDDLAATPNWGIANNNKPAWISDVAVWTSSPGVAWAVTLVVDLSSTGLNITGALKTFWGARLYSDAISNYTAIVGNATPKTNTDPAADRVADTIVPSKSTGWVGLEAPGTCSAGISLDHDDIGVWTGTAGAASPGSLTNTICAATSTTCTTTANTFRVTARGVKNPTPSWVIRPRIRVAMWGSTIANREYAPWTGIKGSTPHDDGIFTDSSTNFTPTNGWYWLTPHDNGDGTSDVTMDYQCKIQGGDTYCPKLPTDHDNHQCMLVELGQSGTTQRFRNNAVYRNMDYAGLSSVSQPATINIAGLEKATGAPKDRDIYLHLETARLPPHGNEPLWLATKDMAVAQELAEHPVRLPKALPQLPGNNGRALLTRPAPGTPAAQAELKRTLEKASRIGQSTQRLAGTVPLSSVLAMSSAQLMDSVWPRIRVRAYFDTGKTLTTKNKTGKVLEPLVPFGLYLSHDGPLFGFTPSLVGLDGVVLEKLADNWFVVRNVKNESSFRVAPGVTAEEHPKGSGSGGGDQLQCPAPQPAPPCPACKVEKNGTCNCAVVHGSTLFAPGLLVAGLAALGLLVRRSRKRR